MDKIKRSAHILLAVIHAQNGRNTHHQRHAQRRRALQILQDQAVIHPGKLLMFFGIDLFQVHKDQIHLLQRRGKPVKVKLTAGFQRQIKALIIQRIHHFPQEHRLRRCFAAGKGHAPAGIAVEHALPPDLAQYILGCGIVGHGVAAGLAFGVGAPRAAQRAARHKHNGADALAIIDRKVLQLHQVTAHCFSSPLALVTQLKSLRAPCGQ